MNNLEPLWEIILGLFTSCVRLSLANYLWARNSWVKTKKTLHHWHCFDTPLRKAPKKKKKKKHGSPLRSGTRNPALLYRNDIILFGQTIIILASIVAFGYSMVVSHEIFVLNMIFFLIIVFNIKSRLYLIVFPQLSIIY